MLRGAFRKGRDRFAFRLAGYSVQHHHLHLLCEAPTAAALGHGLQGLNIRIAYVAANDWKHGNASSDYAGRIDPCSSFYFGGPNRLFAGEEAPVMAARTDHLKAALRLALALGAPP